MTAVLAMVLVLCGAAEARKPRPWEGFVYPHALPASRPVDSEGGTWRRCWKAAYARGGRRRGVETSAASVDLTCEPVDRRTDRVCLEVAPGTWPRLPFEGSCEIGRREIRMAFYAGHPAAIAEGEPLVFRVLTYQPEDQDQRIRQFRGECIPVYDAPWVVGEVACILDDGRPMQTVTDATLREGWVFCLFASGAQTRQGMSTTALAEEGVCVLPTEGGEVPLPVRIESISPTWE